MNRHDDVPDNIRQVVLDDEREQEDEEQMERNKIKSRERKRRDSDSSSHDIRTIYYHSCAPVAATATNTHPFDVKGGFSHVSCRGGKYAER